jgi:hypothetical protein
LKLENVGGDLKPERNVAFYAEGFVVTRAEVLAFPVAKWLMIGQSARRYGQRPIIGIGFCPAALQAHRITKSVRPAAIGIVDEAFSTASVASQFGNR